MADYAIVNLLDLDDVVQGRLAGLEGRFARKREIRQWDVVRVGPEVIRGFEAGPDGLELIAIGGPRPEGGDGVQLDAPWPDQHD